MPGQIAHELIQYQYLVPVEDQTLCCVVSVFVVLKKFTP